MAYYMLLIRESVHDAWVFDYGDHDRAAVEREDSERRLCGWLKSERTIVTADSDDPALLHAVIDALNEGSRRADKAVSP